MGFSTTLDLNTLAVPCPKVPRSYTLSTSHSFISKQNEVLTFDSTLNSDIGQYTVSFTVSDTLDLTSVSTSFLLTVQSNEPPSLVRTMQDVNLIA